MNGNTLSAANAGVESSIDVQAEASRDDRSKEAAERGLQES